LTIRDPVGISLGFPEGVGFWVNPTPLFHAPDGLLLPEEEAGGLLRSRPSFVARGRMALFAGIVGVNVDLQLKGQP
jgi:hypothetical protein